MRKPVEFMPNVTHTVGLESYAEEHRGNLTSIPDNFIKNYIYIIALIFAILSCSGCGKAETIEAKINPTGVFSGNAPMGPSTYIINSDKTYKFIGQGEVGSGTWDLSGHSLSGHSLTFTRGGAQYTMRISDDGNVLGNIWKRK